MKTLTLYFVGLDDWSRPVYRSDDRLYVDVDPRAWRPAEICTKSRNEFYGEPNCPVSADLPLEFIPRRQTWQLIGPMPLYSDE